MKRRTELGDWEPPVWQPYERHLDVVVGCTFGCWSEGMQTLLKDLLPRNYQNPLEFGETVDFDCVVEEILRSPELVQSHDR
jgi:hypothetical protein